jgi:FkbM family methyltransferase
MNLIASIPLKRQAQAFLKQIGLYERLKASRIYDYYWSWADPHWVMDRDKEVQFYRTVLSDFRKGNVVFDIGANDGCKTDIFLRLGARVVAVEPDETNLDVLKGKFLKNRFFPRPLKVEGKAVSDQVGVMSMFIDAPGSALNTLSPKWAEKLRNDDTRFGQRFDFSTEKTVQTTTLENLIAQHGVPFYIKIDVEGHELSVLRGLKQPVSYLSFEVNLPEFKEEGLKCIETLYGIAPEGEFNCVADYRSGLKYSAWMSRKEFVKAFRESTEPMIEIFWRNRW